MDEAHELRRLEESLWRAQTRFDLAYMESLLSPEFVEFGRSGRAYGRREILALEPHAFTARLRNLHVATVTEDVRLVTYVSEVDGELAHRSSLWVRTRERWMLRLHQGTPLS